MLVLAATNTHIQLKHCISVQSSSRKYSCVHILKQYTLYTLRGDREHEFSHPLNMKALKLLSFQRSAKISLFFKTFFWRYDIQYFFMSTGLNKHLRSVLTYTTGKVWEGFSVGTTMDIDPVFSLSHTHTHAYTHTHKPTEFHLPFFSTSLQMGRTPTVQSGAKQNRQQTAKTCISESLRGLCIALWRNYCEVYSLVVARLTNKRTNRASSEKKQNFSSACWCCLDEVANPRLRRDRAGWQTCWLAWRDGEREIEKGTRV